MAAHEKISYGQFGDQRDNYESHRMYQPEGSKNKFHLEYGGGNVRAYRMGKGDSILPGGRPAKQLAGFMSTWKEDPPEILTTEVRKGFRGSGLSSAMLKLAAEKKPGLSHSAALSAEGARFAARNPLPGDTEATKATQARHLTADAATAMLGGPKRRGYT